VQQLLAVLFVLLAVWGAVVFLRKKGFAIATTSLRVRKQAHSIEQLDRMRLTPQHSIHLLRVDERSLLIAVHPHGITILQGDERPSSRDSLTRGSSVT
jgi:flagellar biogenesis protein FliO